MEFKEVAVLAAREAGKKILEISEKGFTSRMKGIPHDMITDADTKAEKIIIDMIRKHFPGHSILSEEMGKDSKDSEYMWVIDPLDGTINFSKGIDEYCVSIALQHRRKIILGVIYRPVSNELYTAEMERGSFLNGSRLKASEENELSRIILSADSSNNIETRKKNFEFVLKVCDKVRTIRQFGSAALNMARVASGKSDAYFLHSFNYWDFAAGKLLVEEAGGKVTDFGGNPITEKSKSIVATNGKIHDKILGILNEKKTI